MRWQDYVWMLVPLIIYFLVWGDRIEKKITKLRNLLGGISKDSDWDGLFGAYASQHQDVFNHILVLEERVSELETKLSRQETVGKKREENRYDQ